MTDIVPPHVRSRMMAGIKDKNTRPEKIIRKGLFALGFRYRIHEKKLPGKPDVVLPKHSAVIFIHGCFWHGHDCYLFRMPESNSAFWEKKINRNREVDEINIGKLFSLGWRILTIWECSLRGKGKKAPEKLITEIAGWINSGGMKKTIRGRKVTIGS